MKETEEKLYQIYQHSTDMIKFAEAKNAGLIAFNGAVIIGIATLVKDLTTNKDFTQYYIVWYLVFVIFMNLISIFISLSSLTALLIHKETETKFKPNDNLQFFGTISSKTPEVFLDSFMKKYNLQSENKEYEIDMARQTVIVSQIAMRKFRAFNTALNWTFAGIATPLSVIIFKFFFNPNTNRS
jgi:hypothetical protein